jgi:hypothetical protein
MTLNQFKYLSTDDQDYVLKKKAVIIGTIYKEEGIYTLFQVDGFYLEVLCQDHLVVPTSINYFDQTELLEPYLELININSVYQILNNSKT